METMTEGAKYISIDRIITEENIRGEVRDPTLYRLADSIQQHGLLEPIGVYNEGSSYKVVYGNRRLAAMKLLGYDKLQVGRDVIVGNPSMTEDEVITFNAIENIQRKDILPGELGRIVARLHDGPSKLSFDVIALRFSETKSRIEEAYNLYNSVPPKYLGRVAWKSPGGKKRERAMIAVGIAHYIEKYIPKKDRETMYDLVSRHNLSIQKLRIVNGLIRAGQDGEVAVENADKYQHVDMYFLFNRRRKEELEEKNRKSIQNVIRDVLRKSSLPKDLIVPWTLRRDR